MSSREGRCIAQKLAATVVSALCTINFPLAHFPGIRNLGKYDSKVIPLLHTGVNSLYEVMDSKDTLGVSHNECCGIPPQSLFRPSVPIP